MNKTLCEPVLLRDKSRSNNKTSKSNTKEILLNNKAMTSM